MKRIMRDARELLNSPIPGVQFRVNDEDCSVWDVVIQWELSCDIIAPLHLVVNFPQEYPAKPPNVGFSCSDIGYTGGATMTEHDRSSPLFGKLIICLDILGNFAYIHTEWASSAGSGWSPAYTMTSLLNNILVVLGECANSMGTSQKSRVHAECLEFMKNFDQEGLVPDIAGAVDIETSVEEDHAAIDVNELVSSLQQSLSVEQKEELQALLQHPSLSTFLTSSIIWAGHNELVSYLTQSISGMEQKCNAYGLPSSSQLQSFVAALSDRISAKLMWGQTQPPPVYAKIFRERFSQVGWDGSASAPCDDRLFVYSNVLQHLNAALSDLNSLVPAEAIDETAVAFQPDPDIICWYSLSHYTEALLGIGISFNKNGAHTNLSTDGSMLSYESFLEGVRQTPTKEAFRCFLPLWITPAHAVDSTDRNWEDIMYSCVSDVGAALGSVSPNTVPHIKNQKLADTICRVFPDLINLTIVRMVQPDSDLRASERVFRLLIDLWRTFRYMYTSLPLVRSKVNKTCTKFASDSSARLKSAVPNIGWLLAMFSVADRDAVHPVEFLSAYVDENFLRCVMWWKKNGCPERAAEVFEATRVSRHLLLFQTFFMRIAIGEDLDATAMLADRTECKLEDGAVERLLEAWKRESNREGSAARSSEQWSNYFSAVGCPHMIRADMDMWVHEMAARAASLSGYSFSGGKGGGRGKGSGGRGGRGKW